MLPAAGWAKLPAATHAEVGARLASTGALRSLDAALRLLAQHGNATHLSTVSLVTRPSSLVCVCAHWHLV